MTSKKEEERNEKIIRGLMKLPPNRRCINCNSLGPQYVCPNFWTFICITCSGIHREFTHRVKSVSMSKFTSQEVDSLQRGGNQRAREIFLKDWDLQRERLPSSSNVVNIREFIKNVYVDKKYAGGSGSDKPPRDIQSLRNLEDETRRASSYHSYSQSPPYEDQYEDRKYGKQDGALTRRPGSDRGHYEGKVSSFVYSPGRLVEPMYEDRFANEGSVSRVSDYSVSSGGDPFRSGAPSPNYQKGSGVSSPPSYPVRDILIEDGQHQTINSYLDGNAKTNVHGVAHQQRTASMSSSGSFDSNSMSLQSVNPGLFDVVSEPEPSARTQLERLPSVASLPQSHVSINSTLNPVASSNLQRFATFSAPSIDLFQTPTTNPAPSVDLFADMTVQQSTPASLKQKLPAVSFVDNEGWATFDMPQHEIPAPHTKNTPPASALHGDAALFGSFDVLPSVSSSMQWASVEDSTTHGVITSIDNLWHDSTREVQASINAGSTKQWNAFDDSLGSVPQPSYGNMMYSTKAQLEAYKPPLDADRSFNSKILENSSIDRVYAETPADRHAVPSALSNGLSNESLFNLSVFPLTAGTTTASHAADCKSTNPFEFDFPYEPESEPTNTAGTTTASHAADCKSTNPFEFDFPYEPESEPTNTFLNMSSLQSALPDPQLQSAFLGDLDQPWYHRDSVTPYSSTAPQGGMPYMTEEAPTSQLSNIPSQGSVASVGGNPFA